MIEDTITITKDEYAELRDAQIVLSCLYAAGVDNWEGYSHALDLQDEEEF